VALTRRAVHPGGAETIGYDRSGSCNPLGACGPDAAEGRAVALYAGATRWSRQQLLSGGAVPLPLTTTLRVHAVAFLGIGIGCGFPKEQLQPV
jgi:hypothetical protein